MESQGQIIKYLDYILRKKMGFKGSYITLIRKWIRKYGLKYTYFVIKKAEDKKNINIGYIIGMLKNMSKEYENSKFVIIIPTREKLLKQGYRIQDLPDYMLTKAERSFFEGLGKDFSVDDVDVVNVKTLLGNN